MKCFYCESYACPDIFECQKESKFNIERIIQSEIHNGPFEFDEHTTETEYLAIVAGRLMKKWFPDD